MRDLHLSIITCRYTMTRRVLVVLAFVGLVLRGVHLASEPLVYFILRYLPEPTGGVIPLLVGGARHPLPEGSVVLHLEESETCKYTKKKTAVTMAADSLILLQSGRSLISEISHPQQKIRISMSEEIHFGVSLAFIRNLVKSSKFQFGWRELCWTSRSI